MTMRRLFAVFVVISTLVFPPFRATPAGVSVVSAVALTFLPGGRDVPAQLRVPQGSSLEFVNMDPLGFHRVDAIDQRDGQPLFSTKNQIGMGETTKVEGVELLSPGVYSFVCPTHDGMTGTLVVS